MLIQALPLFDMALRHVDATRHASDADADAALPLAVAAYFMLLLIHAAALLALLLLPLLMLTPDIIADIYFDGFFAIYITMRAIDMRDGASACLQRRYSAPPRFHAMPPCFSRAMAYYYFRYARDATPCLRDADAVDAAVDVAAAAARLRVDAILCRFHATTPYASLRAPQPIFAADAAPCFSSLPPRGR